MNKQKIAAIVPALNEEKNVTNVLKVLLDSKDIDEIILVDDGSTDRTAAIGENLGVKVVRLPKKGGSGKGNAIMQGLKSTKAEIIAFFDADLIKLSKDHVYSLVQPILKEEAVMSVGIRGHYMGLPKFIAEIDPLLAIGGERVVYRSLLKRIPKKFTKGFTIESALNHYCSVKNLSVKYVALDEVKHIIKEKKWGILKGSLERIKLILDVVKVRIRLYNNTGSNITRSTYNNREVFNTIYRKHKWLFGSGSGSISIFNKPFIQFVNNFLNDYPDIKVIVDIGCGNFKIGKNLALHGKKYIGCDVSDFVLEKVRGKFSSPNKRFLHLDVVSDELPKGDLVILKDVLQHLCNRDVFRVLSKLTIYRYVIIQNDIYDEKFVFNTKKTNKNIKNGGFRPLDIRKTPFNADCMLAKRYTSGMHYPLNALRQIFLFAPFRKGIFVRLGDNLCLKK